MEQTGATPLMSGFKKRTYHGIGDFLADIKFLLRNQRRVRAMMRSKTLSPKFRERLMLAVTRVNACRYCTRFHTKAALTEGVNQQEIRMILQGMYQQCPLEEISAILYAEHWAETEGRPDEAARQKLIDTYGQAMTDEIDIALRVIKTGNYTGNTADYLLYRISFGRWGLTRS